MEFKPKARGGFVNRKTKDVLYLLLAALLLVVTVQRFRAFAARQQLTAGAGGTGAQMAQKLPGSQFPRQNGTQGNRLKEQNGRTLLWAKGDPASEESQWFDVTDAPLDPVEFQYGIGKDTIPAIDEPLFVSVGDPRLEAQRITDGTRVIGYSVGDDARAYPIRIMDRHELVNDTVGGKPVTVGW